MKSRILKCLVCAVSLVFVWGAGGTSFADNAAEVNIQVSYPSDNDYVSYYNGVVGAIDDSRKGYYVNVHVTLLDENGLPATAGPEGEDIASLTATLTTELGIADSIVENVFLSDSATLTFDMVDVGPAARGHVRYACQDNVPAGNVCTTGTDTLEVTVDSLTDTAEVEVKSPDATSLVVRTLYTPGAGPVELFDPISAPSHNAGLAALAGDDIYFEVWAVEENGAFTFAPNLEGKEVTINAYADYNADGTVKGVIADEKKEAEAVATTTANFSNGKATGEIQIAVAGTRSSTISALRVALTAKAGSVKTTQIGSGAASGIGTGAGAEAIDGSTDWVSMLPLLKEKLVIGKWVGGDDGNLIEEVDNWYVLDDEGNSPPTTTEMAVFVTDTYGNPVTQEDVTVNSVISGSLLSVGVTDVQGGWNIVSGVPVNVNPGLAARGGGANNGSEPSGGGPVEGTLTLSDDGGLLTSDNTTAYLVRWDEDAPLSLDLHLDVDEANTLVAGDTVTLYITSASGSFGNPTTAEIVEYNDDLIIKADNCVAKDYLISSSTQGFDQKTDTGLVLKAPAPDATTKHIEIPIKIWGECTQGAVEPVCFEVTDSTKGIKNIPLSIVPNKIANLQPAGETRVKISGISNLSAAALDADPIVVTSTFAVGENTLLKPGNVDTADNYGNVYNDSPAYGVGSELGIATVDDTGGATVLYDEADIGQTDTVTVSVTGVGSRELQIVKIVKYSIASTLLCSREGPPAPLNRGEVILNIKADKETTINRDIKLVIDEENSVENAELRGFSGVSLGTYCTRTLTAGPNTNVVRVVVSAPEAGDVVVQASDVTSGVTYPLDTCSITIPFTEMEHVPPTASISPEDGSSAQPTASIVITVNDDYGVSLNNTVYNVEKDGSDITSSLACSKAGDGTQEGTITCVEPVAAAYSWGGMAAGSTTGLSDGYYVVTAIPQDLLGNVGTEATSSFTVAACTPVVTIDPASANLLEGETKQFSASTSCDGTSPAGTYTWDIMTQGCTGSAIDSNGLYIAPSSISGIECKDTVRVTDSGATATAEVTVMSCTPTVTVTPASAIVGTEGTQQFSAATTCNGSTLTGTYDWTVSGTAGGSIDSNGLYTAGSTAGTDTVTVTDTANGNFTGTATVEVGGLNVSPDPVRRSRWVMLPTLMVLQSDTASFNILTSRVAYAPARAVVPMPRLVLGPHSIWQFVLVNPSWLAGAEDDTLTVTLTTGTEEVSGTAAIEMLPFGLDE